MGLKFHARSVVITVGTFLGGTIHIGMENYKGGRAGDPPSIALADRLRALPFRVSRLKTGTPARLDARTLDYSVMQEQLGDSPTPVFSFMGKREDHPRQIACYITHTNSKTHDIIRGGLDRSPMYTGVIEGIGPRYCPSIEDKINRFADKDSHQIFVEPEGLNSIEVYPNGISTSLPFDVQFELVRSIKGFENAHIIRPGYAIEYDFFDPRDLKQTLETKFIKGLFFAGQINGTTGYEEAGAQGLVAGANASLQCQGKDPLILRRDEAYMGVLIDDLATMGTKEPYRMFTSRAEYRLLLREGHELGLVDEERWQAFNRKLEAIELERQRLRDTWVHPKHAAADVLNPLLKNALSKENTLEDLIRRPEMTYETLMKVTDFGPGIADPKAAEQVEIQIKYAGYIERQQEEIAKSRKNENTLIPVDFDYSQISGLSNEVVAKLTDAKPETLGLASRISGITPAAISLLLVYLKKHGLLRKSERKSA